jgi:uncharacterized repeat protein (TIGR03803 family)
MSKPALKANNQSATQSPNLRLRNYCLAKIAGIGLLLFLCASIASSAQTFKTLVTFNGSNGKEPNGPLVQATNGDFYGTTFQGGAYNGGSVFKVNPAGKLTTLYSFCPQTSPCLDGANPRSGLVQAASGEFYGTTFNGGVYASGTVFKMTAQGKLTTIYSFCSVNEPRRCADGSGPIGGLVQASNGDLYGTTPAAGAHGLGSIFKVNSRGKLTTIYSFHYDSGEQPAATLVQADNDNLYGTTVLGGTNRHGAIFEITPEGSETTLYSFCKGDCVMGNQPSAGLVQATDGNLYGAAVGPGSVFKLTLDGTVTKVYSFCSLANCADGSSVVGTLVQGTDGNFYGGTLDGGAHDQGTIFQLTPEGQLTTLYSFCAKTGCADGAASTSLIQSTSGTFYGTTALGGMNQNGVIFSLSLGSN